MISPQQTYIYLGTVQGIKQGFHSFGGTRQYTVDMGPYWVFFVCIYHEGADSRGPLLRADLVGP